MQNNMRSKNRIAVFGTLKVMVSVSLLVAMSIVCGKYLAFGVGNVLRFSFENLPIIISGMLFGPIVGIITGIVADIVGCIMVGYAINPLITAGAAVIGGISGLVFSLLGASKVKHILKVTMCTGFAHLFGSVIIKTLGLASFYDMPFTVLLLWRLLNYAVVGTVETVLIYYITKNRSIISMISRIKGKSEL